MSEKELKIIRYLSDEMINYDMILLYLNDVGETEELFTRFLNKRFNKKILLIFDKIAYRDLNNIDYICIDKDSRMLLHQLYYTYEFSDKFMMFSWNCNYGTIWNYVKTGLLSTEEAISVLLD